MCFINDKDEEDEDTGEEREAGDGRVSQDVGGDAEPSAAGAAREKVGFRDRKIIDYENRIRSFSTPDKIFRYFATYKVQGYRGV